jgi:ubiquinone/menaquinone biosynthesis C-methylase UbiE
MGHKFAPQNWERLLSDERRQLLNPERFLGILGIREGDAVADIGAGPGFFTLPLAERVGPLGKVYALDVAPEMVEQLHLRRLPPQVEVLLSAESSLPLPSAVADVALLAFVLHEVHDQRAFLAEIGRILRPGGRLVVLEWIQQEELMGPPLHERIGPADASRVLASADFRVLDDGQVNASHYFCIASPVG